MKEMLWQAARSHFPFEVRTLPILMEALPRAFEGFRIVQISDLHIDHWNRSVVETAIDVVNGLQADLLICTGDVIADGARFLPDVTFLLKQFQARLGKLACLGNHDYSDGNGGTGTRYSLETAGFEVLVNGSLVLTQAGQRLRVAGVDDLLLGRQCLQQTRRALEGEPPAILLSHNPENFEALATLQPGLVLSGHTHGGQIHLPYGLHRRLFGTRYLAGLYRHEGSQLYVNRGLGSAVFVHQACGKRLALPTPRWAVHPEISVFELQCLARIQTSTVERRKQARLC